MITTEQIKILRLGIEPINDRLCLIAESALIWVQNNTKFKFDINSSKDLESLTADVRLFVAKYIEIMKLRAGITSESIGNLSQSFDTKDLNAAIWQIATDVFTDDELLSNCDFIGSRNRWR